MIKSVNQLDESGIIKYANFGTRLGAFILDGIVIVIFFYFIITNLLIPIIRKFGSSEGELNEGVVPFLLFMYIFGLPVIGIIYRSLFESSALQGTPGKAIVGIKVVDINSNRISLQKALLRNFVKIFSSMIFYIGFLVAIRDYKCVTWHDSAASTFVIEK